jgi:DNA-binding LacI/PurR family transcriptional regulator
MADVAARAGVSRALASLVFRGQPGPSPRARERIWQAAAELDYRPNSVAQMLARNRSKVIGVLLTVGDPFHAQLVEAIYPAAADYGYDLLLGAHIPSRDERTATEALLDHQCEALVLLGPITQPKLLANLLARVPVVVVGPRPRGTNVDSVQTAIGKGVRQAVDHLVGLGHRAIVHIDGGPYQAAALRRSAYRAAMRWHGLDDQVRIIPGDYTERSGADAAETLLHEPHLPDAILAANDLSAIGALNVLVRARVDVPGDVSIVGFDDNPLSQLRHINLTTVRQDAQRMGQLAMEVAVDRLEGRRSMRQEIVLQPTLVIRATTGQRPLPAEDLETASGTVRRTV